ncbi:MAG: 16S rRNA pseudouridine(516) synthase, partial [Myxococcota bacterium]
YTGSLVDHAIELCLNGITLDDDPKPTLPAKLTFENPGTATLVLQEGRYHQARRMMTALGGHVLALHRDQIGQLALPEDLPPGECRPLTNEEIKQLLTASEDVSPE